MRAVAWCVLLLAAGCRLDFDDVDRGSPPAERVCPDGVMYCDDFESGDLSAYPVTTIAAGAQLDVDSTMIHSGAFALHSTVPAIRNGAAAAVIFGFPSTSSGMLAVREWVYLPVPLVKYDGVLTIRGAQTDYASVAGDNLARWT